MKKKFIYLIFILAALVRFISLTNLPPALNRDEAAIGWNAYSILQTARDEHGQYLPLAFKSIGDYKMPLYIYATIIPVKLFGLNDFSIRFWSAFAGVASIIAIYYLTLKLTKKTLPSVISASFFALNPWAIFYSRIGFEANLALAFFLTGLCLILKGLKKPSRFYGGLSLFLLSFLTYSSSLIFIPLLLVVLFFLHKKELVKFPKLASLVIFALLSLLIFKSIWSVSSQKSNITVFSNPTIINQYNQTRTKVFDQNPLLAKTWWNKQVFMTRLVANNYLKTFSPKFLLTVGGNHPWHRMPQVGNFYFLEIILAIFGLWWLVKQPDKKLKVILLSWLILAPLPSAITIDAPHSTRSLHLLPIILILAALGFSYLYKTLKLKKPFILLISVIFFIEIAHFGFQYTKIYPQYFPESISLGLKESLRFIKTQNINNNIYLYGIHSSNYLYPLVYLKLDPADFQKTAIWTQPDLSNLTNVYQFSSFTVVDDYQDIKDPQIIIWPDDQFLFTDNLKLLFQSGRFQVYVPN
ncbi:ArnT family glycosyltransferase [Patescibacteria group bacterium]